MDNSLQNALKNLIENQATSDELELLRQALSNGQIFIGGNVRNSLIIVGNGNTVQLSAEAVDRLTAVTSHSALHQLPQPPADFVGREKELKTILSGLEKKSGAAISGLVGMGGIGKTALGLVVAHSLVAQYSDAQFFIDLRGTSKNHLKPHEVMKHVIQSCDPTVDLRNTAEDELAGMYQSLLAEKKVILFLDNAHDASQVTPLRPPANCLMLVTARWHFTVPGLHSVQLDVLKERDAVRLLTEISPRITKKDARRIAKLCGYLPIALRLAASYLQIHSNWTAEEYIARLSDKTKRLQALDLEGADVSIEASFEQSYMQLSKDEQSYWSKMAVFSASFKRDALATVWNLDDEATRKLASRFCQYSLLEYYPVTDRYNIHDLWADFADAKLAEADKTIALLNHFRHYQNVWKVAEELYAKGGEGVIQGLITFDAESIHIESAYQWAIENKDTNGNITAVIKEIPDFVYVARTRLHPNQQIKWFQAALDAANNLEDLQNQNKLLGNIGTAYASLSENNKAIEYWGQALMIAREIGDRQRQGFWLGNLGVAYSNLGENRKAIEYFEQALVIARDVGDQHRQVFWLGNIGGTYYDLGENHKAIEYFEQGLEIARKIEDLQQQGHILGGIGVTYVNLGEFNKAIEYMLQALEISRTIGDQVNECAWLGNIGDAYTELGEYRKAIEYKEQALKISRETGDRQQQGFWLGGIGLVYGNQGEWHKSIDYFEQGLNIAREIGDRLREGLWLGNIGVAYDHLGGLDKAIQCLEQALSIAREVGDQKRECGWLNQFGELYIKIGITSKAKENLEQALILSKELGERETEAESLFSFAKLSQLEHNHRSALQYAQDARSILEAIKSPNLAELDQFIESLNQTP